MIEKVSDHKPCPLTREDIQILYRNVAAHGSTLFVHYAQAHAKDYALMLARTDAGKGSVRCL